MSTGTLRAVLGPPPAPDPAHAGDNGGYGERGFPQLDGYRDNFGGAAVNAVGETRSMGAAPMNGAVTGMVTFGSGYLMVAADGGIFNVSDRAFHGSPGDNPSPHPVVAVAALP